MGWKLGVTRDRGLKSLITPGRGLPGLRNDPLVPALIIARPRDLVYFLTGCVETAWPRVRFGVLGLLPSPSVGWPQASPCRSLNHSVLT